MKKLVSVLLALVMVLVAVSALAAPKNIAEIEGLPEMPEIPTMYVKSHGDVVTVTMSGPVAWLAAVRNWGDYTQLEFDENNVATYSTSGDKVNPGFGLWGWSGGGQVWEEGTEHWAFPELSGLGEKTYKEAIEEGEEASNEFSSWKIKNKQGSYGVHNTGTWQQTVHGATDEYPNGYKEIKIKDMIVQGGSYAMSYAYHGATADGVEIYYDTHGKIIKLTQTVTGQNFLGSETAPVESKITWTYGSNIYGKLVIYVSNITEKIDDETSISADFASNGKCLRCR